MTSSPLDRARQALIGEAQRTQPAVLDQAKGNALLARARTAAEARPETRATPPAAALSTPRVERVRVQMTCGVNGQPFTALAERRGNGLLLVDHELPRPGRGAGGPPAERLSGSYRVDTGSGWSCPHCGSRDDTWSCGCAAMPASLHCGGRRGRLRYCACGKLEERNLVEVETIEVRGQSMASTSKSAPPASPRGDTNLPALLPKR